MILVIDIGNTTCRFGLFKDDEILAVWKLMTAPQKSSDEYTILINAWFLHNGFDKKQVKGVVISSVVPNVMHSFINTINKTFNITPLIVKAGIKTGIFIQTDDPREVGADRIADAVAGYYLHGGPCLVLDFGTATTYNMVGSDGIFFAAVTAPGIQISADALWSKAALLPHIEIKSPPSILAKNTITSMQAGLVFGHVGSVEYIVNKMKKDSGYLDAKVIATGGYAQIIESLTDVIDVYDPMLTLKGMKIIWDKNNAKK
ncbi:MAG: type III pantothenate kinase [Eubacteriaceae bacterium]|nr:type III pantothenate kinase [Eubacteriaceae bacterium]